MQTANSHDINGSGSDRGSQFLNISILTSWSHHVHMARRAGCARCCSLAWDSCSCVVIQERGLQGVYSGIPCAALSPPLGSSNPHSPFLLLQRCADSAFCTRLRQNSGQGADYIVVADSVQVCALLARHSGWEGAPIVLRASPSANTARNTQTDSVFYDNVGQPA